MNNKKISFRTIKTISTTSSKSYPQYECNETNNKMINFPEIRQA